MRTSDGLATRSWRLASDRLLVAVLAVALAIRVAYSMVLPNTTPANPDSLRYISIADNLLQRGEYADSVGALYGEPLQSDSGPTCFWLPGYPIVVAIVRRFFTGSSALYVANALIGTATVYLGYRASRLAIGEEAALWTALLLAVNPSLIYYVGFIGIETLVALCLVAALEGYLASVKALRERTRADANRPLLTLGLALGYGSLTRSIVAPVAVITIGMLFYEIARVSQWRRAALACVTPVACVIMLVSPWLVRNYLTFGRVVYESKTGFNMVIGFNDQADGTFSLAAVPNLDQRHYSEVERDDLLKSMALGWIQSHPFQSANLALRKLIIFWSPLPATQRGVAFVISAGWNSIFLLLVAVGLLLSRRRFPDTRIILLIAIAYCLPVAAAFSITRFRVPLEAALSPLAGFALHELWRLAARRHNRAAIAAGQ